MKVGNNTFYKELTYNEWASQQNKNNLEFKAIEVCHKNHQGYNLEEIRNYIYLNVVENENNQKIFQENFGERHVNSTKLNEQLSKLTRILFSISSEFKSVDKRGHGDTISTRLGGRGKSSEVVSFRIEEKAIRYAHYLIEHNLVSYQTISDIVRAGFIKLMEMVPVVNELRDSVTDRFVLDMQMERERQEKLIVDEMLETFEGSLEVKEQDLMDALRHIENREELEELRDWAVNFVRIALSYNGPTKSEKARVREFIMRNSRLYNIFMTFEREKLLTKEYIDNVRIKGIHSHAMQSMTHML